MEEQWRSVKGFEGRYEISSLGRVKSLERVEVNKNGVEFNVPERIMKIGYDGNKYKSVGLSLNGTKKGFLVHVLIAVAFLGHKPDGTNKVCVDHIDNIKDNTYLSNLRLTTNRENSSKDKSGGTSEYIGVSYDNVRSKWKVGISYKRKWVHLGYYKNELDASDRYVSILNYIRKNDITLYEFEKYLGKVELSKTSKHVGVSWNKDCGIWRSFIGIDGKQVYLGRFDTETEASEAYQKALKNKK